MDLEPSPPPASPPPPQGDVHFFYPNPPFKDDWKPNTQNFVGISEKKKSATPIQKPVILTGTGKRESRKELSEDY